MIRGPRLVGDPKTLAKVTSAAMDEVTGQGKGRQQRSSMARGQALFDAGGPG